MRTPLGMFQQVSACPACGGSGETSTPCPKCQGDGRIRGGKRISLRVPPGVDEGSRLRVRGEGDAGRRWVTFWGRWFVAVENTGGGGTYGKKSAERGAAAAAAVALGCRPIGDAQLYI